MATQFPEQVETPLAKSCDPVQNLKSANGEGLWLSPTSVPLLAANPLPLLH
jgi:hypothetical protein